jgi:hypothetical protein
MKCISLLRHFVRLLTSVLALLVIVSEAYAVDTYNPLSKQLTIPSLAIGSTTYTDMVITVGSIVSGPTGTTPLGSGDTYNPASNQLTVPSVLVGTTSYNNVVVTVSGLTSVAGVSGADSYDGTYLSVSSVQVSGGSAYRNSVVTVGNIVSVAGGMPHAAQDSYTPANQELDVPAVQFGGKVYTNVKATVATIVSAAAPFGHVVIVVDENAAYTSWVGSSTMPYLNSLIASYGLATQYYADTHPSIGNYEMLVTGQILTNNEAETPALFPIYADNIVRELTARGKTWKAYAEGIPSQGYVGGNTGYYVVEHVPLAYLADVQGSAYGRIGLVPFYQFATDIAASQLPNFSFVTPNACNDGQDCALGMADSWLQANIPPLLASTPFKDDGLLIILFDESSFDNTNGGGRVGALLISPAFSKPGYQSATLYQHESALRLMLEGLGVHTLPGAAATAPAMWEFFTFPPP